MDHSTMISLITTCVAVGASYGALRVELRQVRSRLYVAEQVLMEIRDHLMPIIKNCPIASKDCPLTHRASIPLPESVSSSDEAA